MTTYMVDTGTLGGIAGEAEEDAAIAESLRALSRSLRTLALAAGSERVAQSGLALASRMSERIEAGNIAGMILASALRGSAAAYAEVERRVDALFVPRWIP